MVEEHVNLPSADADRRKIFPFFKLARELRDAIYDERMDDWTIDGAVDRPEICAKNTVSPHLLLVNRQFAAEYASRAQKCGTLTFTDKTHGFLMPFRLPELLCKQEHALGFKIWCPCYTTAEDQRVWIDDILSQVTMPRSLSVTVICGRDQEFDDLLADLHTPILAAIPGLVTMQVYRQDLVFDEAEPLIMWQHLAELKYIGSWSKNSGKLDDMQVIEEKDGRGDDPV